jgi:hypothetical protein
VAPDDTGVPVLTNGDFTPCTVVRVGEVEYFRTVKGDHYRRAHPMQKASIIYQPKTPGLPVSRMVLLDPMPPVVREAFERHDDGLKCVGVTTAGAPVAPVAVPKEAQTARSPKGRSKKPVRGLAQ